MSSDPHDPLRELLALLRAHPDLTINACAVRLGWTHLETRQRLTALSHSGHVQMRRVYSVTNPQEGQS